MLTTHLHVLSMSNSQFTIHRFSYSFQYIFGYVYEKFSQIIIMLTIPFCSVLIKNIHLYIYTNNSHWGFVFDFQMSRYTARQETSWRRHYQSAWKNILIKTLAWEGYNLFLVSFHLILDFVVFTFNIVSITIPRAYKVSNTRIRVYIL